jgi:hypothetical protein
MAGAAGEGAPEGVAVIKERNGFTVPARNVPGGDVLFASLAGFLARAGVPARDPRQEKRRARAGSPLPAHRRRQPGAAPALRPTADVTNEGGITAW